MRIAVVDYQMGNVMSVVNAFQGIGCDVTVTQERSELARAERIVLPGVGAFGEGMKHLKELGLIDILEEEVLRKRKPFLGICLGMQLLAEEGHEFGFHKGLGWIPGSVKKLEVEPLVLPHVGWNNLEIANPYPLLDQLGVGADFYFVHSFHFVTLSSDHAIAACDYGKKFTAVIHKENIFGVQFHPEKSQKAGKILLENFVRLP